MRPSAPKKRIRQCPPIQVIKGFLGELHSITLQEDVIVIGACNFIDLINPAVLCVGRFGAGVLVPLPDAAGHIGLLRKHLKVRSPIRISPPPPVHQSAAARLRSTQQSVAFGRITSMRVGSTSRPLRRARRRFAPGPGPCRRCGE
jgi:SpoVK/Ycf46/Vps4 family AAA+-type ATPase